MIFHIHQIDAVPVRAEANLKQRADGGPLQMAWGGIPFCLFDICLKRGEKKKKKELSLSRQLLE
jgi:hypothetical protein